MEACVTFKTCGDTSKVAATLHRHQHCQSLSIMFMRFMLYVLSKHAEKHQDTPAKQQLSLHKTSAAMQTWARSRSTEPPMSPQTAANQHKQPSEEPMRAADSPLEERGWSGGVSGGRGHPLRLLWVKRNHEVRKHQLWCLFWSLNELEWSSWSLIGCCGGGDTDRWGSSGWLTIKGWF